MATDPARVVALEAALDDVAIADYVEGNFAAIVAPHVPAIVEATVGEWDEATKQTVLRALLEDETLSHTGGHDLATANINPCETCEMFDEARARVLDLLAPTAPEDGNATD